VTFDSCLLGFFGRLVGRGGTSGADRLSCMSITDSGGIFVIAVSSSVTLLFLCGCPWEFDSCS
jgi:hypothetical protein